MLGILTGYHEPPCGFAVTEVSQVGQHEIFFFYFWVTLTEKKKNVLIAV